MRRVHCGVGVEGGRTCGLARWVWAAVAVVAGITGTNALAQRVPGGEPKDVLHAGHVETRPETAGLSPEVAAREIRECVLPDQPAQTRSLWNSNHWPGGIVPYEFDANVTPSNQTAMRQAMDVLEAAAYVRFVPRNGEANALHIQDSSGNNSFVGMIGGVQTVNIFNWNFRYIMCHELMHALGISHEQSRSDRGPYVSINLGNVCQTCCSGGSCNHNFNINASAAPEGTYDFDSVMHYSATAFSVNGQPTIVAQPAYAQYQSLMGQRTHLSIGDIAGLVSRYGDPTPLKWKRKGEHPGAMSGHAMAYDSGRGVTVLHDGFGIWEWDGSSWTRATVAFVGGSFEPRHGHALAYDAARGVTVLFGGRHAFGQTDWLGDTWEWNGTTLTQRVVSGPTFRAGHSMAYDAARGVVVLFGGSEFHDEPDPNWVGQYFSDTWEWDGTAWTQRMVTGPSARGDHAMAYDAARGVTVLFGGTDEFLGGVYYDDTWEWNGTSWTQRTVTGPSPRSQLHMAFDSARGVMVLYGGQVWMDSDRDWYLETWEWNGTAWTERGVNFPGSAYGGAMVYDAARGESVLFGGESGSSGTSAQTWRYDGNDWEQKELSSPSPRLNHAMAFDGLRGVTVLFGGNTEGDTINGETWEWNGAFWRQLLVSGPSPRYSHAMAFDAARGVTVLYGGYTDNGYSGETWEWNGTAWTQRFDPTPPPVLRNHAMAYDPDRGVIVMFGGYTGSVFSDSTWEWNGTAWNVRSVSAPSARYYHTMSYDTLRHTMVLFAGGTNDNPLGDTWELDGAEDWSLVANSGPSARYLHAMVFDAAEGKAVMFGGYNDVTNNAETWTWDGAAWFLTPASGPIARRNHAMAYDSLRGKTVMFGGRSEFNPYDNETWELGAPCSPVVIQEQPVNARSCEGGTANFAIGATGSVPRTYRWESRVGGVGAWSTLINGAIPGIGQVQGATSNQIAVTVGPAFTAGTQFRCALTNECTSGSVTSTPATLFACPADMNSDTGIDINDLLTFLAAFEAGEVEADLTSGGQTCGPDGGVDINDLLYFLGRFEGGC